MKTIRRFIGACLLGLFGLAASAAVLFGYFLYTPDPQLPQLSGTLSKGSVTFDGLNRTYQTYLPKGLPKGAPLVLVMHGSGESAAEIRLSTGYGFERLADTHGFAVVYLAQRPQYLPMYRSLKISNANPRGKALPSCS